MANAKIDADTGLPIPDIGIEGEMIDAVIAPYHVEAEPLDMVSHFLLEQEIIREHPRLAMPFGNVLDVYNRNISITPKLQERVPLVTGEEGVVNNFAQIAVSIAQGTDNEIEAWMLGRTMAAGVASAQEMQTGEVVSSHIEEMLANEFTDFALGIHA